MKRSFLAALLSVLLVSGVASACDGKGKSIIAVVDVEKVVTQSLAGKDIIGKIEKKRKEYADQINSQDKALQKDRDELQKKQAILAPDAFAKQQKSFEEKVLKFQRDTQEKRTTLEKAYATAMNEIDAAAKDVTQDLSKDRGLIAVLPNNTVIYYEETIDITNEIIKKLDKKLTKVNVTIK